MDTFSLIRFFCTLSLLLFLHQNLTQAQVQDFERDFVIVNHPEMFLPGWSANEVRATASRVFQANLEGRNLSRALAVQPISTFSGMIYTQVEPVNYKQPKIAFFAKTKRNGSGNRPASVSIHLSLSGFEDFEYQFDLGQDYSFPNQDTEYQLVELPLPQALWTEEVIYVKIEVGLGAGSGSGARFFIDDFGIFDGDEVVDPTKIKEAYLLDPYRIALHLDKPVEAPSIGQVQAGNLNGLSLIFPTDTLVILESPDLIPMEVLPINLQNLQDERGIVTPTTSINLDNRQIQLGEVLLTAPHIVRLSFSHFFEEASVSRSANFRLNNRQPNDIQVGENRYQIDLLFDREFELGQWLALEVSEISNHLGEAQSLPMRKVLRYEDHIEVLYLSEQNQLDLFSSLPLDRESFSIADIQVEENPEIKFTPSFPSPSQIRLKAEIPFEEGPIFSLLMPARKSLRGLPIHASKRDFFWDRTPPELVKVAPLDANKTLLIFSEALDPVFALLPEMYRIDGTSPTEVLLQKNDSQVILTFPRAFEIGRTYVLQVIKASDLSGNFGEDYEFEFVFEKEALLSFKSIVINELMPAPRPGNSLPNVEYVELYNPGEQNIYLGGMQLANSRRVTTLPSAVLGPKSYLILCPRTRAAEFERYGEVLGLTNWPTLLNTADQVKLFDSEGRILDSLNYTSSSFGGTEFARGGYSLELMNPYLLCHLPENLKASRDEKRGTPGKQNSVYETSPDLSPPTFIKGIWVGEKEVILHFSKILNTNLENISWEFNPGINLKQVETGPAPHQILLRFEEDLKEGIKYQVKISNLRDCSGNLFDKNQYAWMAKPSEAVAGDVVINEVLFNARVQAPKFVEVYNTSGKFINLKDWKLANLNSAGEVANRRILFTEDYVLEPFSHLVFTTDAERLYQEYPKGDPGRFIAYATLPSFPISSGNVIFLSPDEQLKELFSYHERMHHSLLRDRRGVSLERLSPLAPVDDPNNWQSAAASVGFATPGRRNSQVFEGQEGMGIEIHPKVFNPELPGPDAYVTISYKMDVAGKTANVRIYSVNGTLIRDICQNAIWGREGFYLWDGTDSSGRKVRPGHYVLWAEVFDLEGKVSSFKKTVVVGTFF